MSTATRSRYEVGAAGGGARPGSPAPESAPGSTLGAGLILTRQWDEAPAYMLREEAAYLMRVETSTLDALRRREVNPIPTLYPSESERAVRIFKGALEQWSMQYSALQPGEDYHPACGCCRCMVNHTRSQHRQMIAAETAAAPTARRGSKS